MKTRRIIALFLALVMLGTMCACGSSTGSGETAKNDTDKPIELSFSIHDSQTSVKGQYTKEWVDTVNAASNGGLNVTLYAGGALAAANTVLEAIDTGACDIGMVYSSHYDTVFSCLNAITLPMLGIGSCEEATNILWDMYEQLPEVQAEFEDYVVIQMYSNGCSYLHFADTPVNTYDAFQGMPIKTDGGIMNDYIAACGASPVKMDVSEAYDALSKGIVKGNICNGSQMNSWNLYEVNKYFLDMPLYVGVWMTLMSRDTYNSLPNDMKQVIDANSGRESSLKNAALLQAETDASYANALENGCEWISISSEELAKFTASADGCHQAWIDSHTTGDFNAQDYFDRFMAVVEAGK